MSYRFKVLKFYLASNPFGFAAGEAAVSSTPISIQLDPSFSDLDLPFATKLYYSTFTISYTPRFPYQFKMTLISHSRKPKNSDRLAEATRAAMTARTFQFNIRVSSVVVRLCPNVYHTSEYVLDRL